MQAASLRLTRLSGDPPRFRRRIIRGAAPLRVIDLATSLRSYHHVAYHDAVTNAGVLPPERTTYRGASNPSASSLTPTWPVRGASGGARGDVPSHSSTTLLQVSAALQHEQRVTFLRTVTHGKRINVAYLSSGSFRTLAAMRRRHIPGTNVSWQRSLDHTLLRTQHLRPGLPLQWLTVWRPSRKWVRHGPRLSLGKPVRVLSAFEAGIRCGVHLFRAPEMAVPVPAVADE